MNIEHEQTSLIRDLSERTKRNQFGLPEGIYRCDLLTANQSANGGDHAPALLNEGESQVDYGSLVIDLSDGHSGRDGPNIASNGSTKGHDEPDPQLASKADEGAASDVPMVVPLRVSTENHIAYVSISYVEGFPTLPNNMPLWLRFDWEPPEAFQAFEAYRESGKDRARQLASLEVDTVNGYDTSNYADLFWLYYWADRARAYDLFRTAEFRKRQYNRALELDDDHYLKAAKLFNVACEYIDSEDFIDQLTPKAAIDLLKVAAQLQRVSVGLPAQAPAEAAKREGMSIEVILENLAQSGAVAKHPEATVIDEAGYQLDRLLADPEQAALAQRLIISANRYSSE